LGMGMWDGRGLGVRGGVGWGGGGLKPKPAVHGGFTYKVEGDNDDATN